jgi:hypothetical protein
LIYCAEKLILQIAVVTAGPRSGPDRWPRKRPNKLTRFPSQRPDSMWPLPTEAAMSIFEKTAKNGVLVY